MLRSTFGIALRATPVMRCCAGAHRGSRLCGAPL